MISHLSYRVATFRTGQFVLAAAMFVLGLSRATSAWDDQGPAPEAIDAANVDLSTIQDNDYLNFEENEAYYGLLHRAANTSLAELRPQAKAFLQQREQATKAPLFKDMLDNPGLYRGQPVTFRGHILNVVSYDAAENPWGIEQVYEAALFTDDSQGHPMTIVFLDRPADLPLGDKLVDGVEVTGYFFKIYYYPSADKVTRRAPLILANTVQVAKPRAAEPLIPGWAANTGAVLLVLALVGIVWWVQSRDQKLSRERQQHEISTQLPDSNPPTPLPPPRSTEPPPTS